MNGDEPDLASLMRAVDSPMMPMDVGMAPDIAPNVEAAIEQAIDEMDRMEPGGPLGGVMPVLEL